VFHWRESGRWVGGRLELAVTDRGGRHDPSRYAAGNLALHVGDDPDRVRDNRSRLAAALGVPGDRLLFVSQVHGAAVAVARGPWTGPAPEADAVVATVPDLAVAVLVADCVPVLLVDRSSGVVAAVHAGRPGLVAGVVPAALRQLHDLGATDLEAILGPSVCGRCYEVPAAMRDEVCAVVPESAATSWTGTPALDVAAGVVAQLRAGGAAVRRIGGCTREDERLYSYRRDRHTGRFAAVAVLRGDGPAGEGAA